MDSGLAVRARVAGDGKRDEGEGDRIEPVGEAAVELGVEQARVALVEFVAVLGLHQIGRRAVLRLHGDFVGGSGKLTEIKGIGVEADDRDFAARRLAVDDALIHHQHLLLVAFDERAVLGIIDEVDIGLARIGDEDAAQPAIGQALADLHEQAIVDLAEGAFLDDQRQKVGARGRDQLAVALARHRVGDVVDDEGKHRRADREDDDRPDDGEPRGAGGIEDHQLGIAVHRAQRQRHGDDDGKRHDDGNDRRQDQGRDLEEGQRRLAAVGDEVDATEHLGGPDDRQCPRQRRDEHRERTTQNVALNNLHR